MRPTAWSRPSGTMAYTMHRPDCRDAWAQATNCAKAAGSLGGREMKRVTCRLVRRLHSDPASARRGSRSVTPGATRTGRHSRQSPGRNGSAADPAGVLAGLSQDSGGRAGDGLAIGSRPFSWAWMPGVFGLPRRIRGTGRAARRRAPDGRAERAIIGSHPPRSLEGRPAPSGRPCLGTSARRPRPGARRASSHPAGRWPHPR